MSEITEEISRNINTRLKNPLVFGFFISWITIHAKDILYFVFSDNKQKLELLSNYKASLICDFIYPLLGVFAYILIIPFMTRLYHKHIKGFNELKQLEIDNENDKKKLKELDETNRLNIQSSFEYKQKSMMSELDKWAEDKINMQKIITEEKSKIKFLENEVSKLTNDLSKKEHIILTLEGIQRHYHSIINTAAAQLSFPVSSDVIAFDLKSKNDPKYELYIAHSYLSSTINIYKSLNSKPLSIDDDDWTPILSDEVLRIIEQTQKNILKIIEEGIKK